VLTKSVCSPVSASGASGQVYLGHLVVEPRRHVSGLAGLTTAEAAALAQWAAKAARALKSRACLLVSRLDEWPDAPLGDRANVTRLVDDIRAHLDAGGHGR
jgi:hypothetical protein